MLCAQVRPRLDPVPNMTTSKRLSLMDLRQVHAWMYRTHQIGMNLGERLGTRVQPPGR